MTTEDARSLSSWAPKFDAARRVISTNWGIDRGVALGLPEDFSGRPLPPIGIVDVGAYEGGP